MKKTVFVSTLMIAAVSFSTVYAGSVYWEQPTGDSFKIYGKTDSAEPGERVTICVFAPGKSADDIDRAEAARNVIAYQDEKSASEDGLYEFVMGVNHSDGTYTAIVRPKGDDSAASCSARIMSQSDYEAAVDEINSASTAAEMTELLKKYGGSSVFAYQNDIGITADEISAVLSEGIKDGKFSKTDYAANNDLYKKSVIIAGIQSGKAGSVFDYSKELELDSGSIKDYYKKEYVTAAVKADITQRLKKMRLTSRNFNVSLAEAFVLSVVKNPDGVDNALEIVTVFADEIFAADIPSLNRSTMSSVCGKDYSDYAALAAAVRAAASESKDNGNSCNSGNSGNSGGSSRGGSAGGGISAEISIPSVNPTDRAEPMNKDIFDDISSVQWARDAIIYLAENGIVNGKSANEFCPDDSITRAEFVKMLVGAMKIPQTGKTELNFSDVSPDDWYCSSVAAAFDSGIVNGYAGTFGAHDCISREDICTMLLRALRYSGKDISAEEPDNGIFADFDSISDYAKDSVYALNAAGVVSGRSGGMFAPKSNATRAEAAKMIYMILMMK